jgi:diguanylate cyclase (GGDEF)-like protein
MEAHITQSSLADRYRVLLDIGRTLTGTLSAESLYETIYRETAKVLEASGFYISLYDESQDLATVVFYADQGEERPVEISYRGSDSEVLRTGKSSLIDDGIQRHSLLVLGKEESEITRSAISAALAYQGRVIGALSAQSYRPGAYRESDLELLQGIADIAAIAIVNARRVAELNLRRLEAERIEEIGRAITGSLESDEVLRKVVHAVLEILGADGCHVWLPKAGKIRIAASGGSIQAPEDTEWDTARIDGLIFTELVERRSPILIDDLSKSEMLPDALRGVISAGSAIAVPLIVEGEVAGALSAGKVEAHAFSQEDVHALQRLAGQASVALKNAKLHSSIQALSLTDPLTGLPNRRHLRVHMEREIAAARRGRPLNVVLFDLDDFKRHNDELGHVVGDEILALFGGILKTETRAMNLAARFGGDEFIVVLSEITLEGAVAHAKRIQEKVASEPKLAQYGVTVSFGIGAFDPDSMTDAEEVIHLADTNLYRSKEETDT